MSIPARRVCTTIQRRAARSAPKLSRSSGSHAHHDHHDEQPHPWTYPKETFTSRPWIISGAVGVLLLGMYEGGLLDNRDENSPITRYIAGSIPKKETILEENLERIEFVKEKAADYRLASSARQDTFKPMRNIGSAAIGSPHGVAVRPTPDMSEIKPKRLPRQD
ncbi:hypothetical protein M408DRAFT_327611 [Serendipita vermifera MAFF 305830]|uniref:Uncharacterized protein n=1 Tax=Serendipita vermifera MAFF 305830 TaxID=933852 RepID=A0A0C2XR01_SERVB|nr:hypothetical protein M408DRAFT_327611 [Serendipita vermifera MAFF 305830]